MTRDINGYNGFGIQPTYDAYGCYLTASAAQSVTVPSNYANWIAIFSFQPGVAVWVDFVTTATLPTATMGAVTTVLNPAARAVVAGQVISFITDDATDPWVGVEFQISPTYQN